MEHFCWFIKLLFLLLMMLKMPILETRPLRGAQHSDIIAGNEFLKLFLARDELQRELHSSEYQGRSAGGGSYYDDKLEDNAEELAMTNKATGRSTSARSLDYKSRNLNEHSGNEAGNSQVVKLVTSGSKIVFLEDEYDEEHAVADAVDIELKKEHQIEPRAKSEQQRLRNQSDEVKVVAVSVSSSSKRNPVQTHANEHSAAHSILTRQMHSFPVAPAETSSEEHSRRKQQQHQQLLQQQQRQAPKEHKQQHKSQQHTVSTSSTSKPLTTRMTTTPTTTASTTLKTTTKTTSASPAVEFINRSHKSELLIEEAEPLTMTQSGKPAHSASTSFSSATDLFYDTDSENSASTNIRNVLAAPLARTPKSTPATESEPLPHSAAATTTYHSSNHTASRINQLPSRIRVTHADNNNMPVTTMSPAAAALEDKLLPFQTVIYHDTKEGHGPQSRSISYSSISQNVEDLQAWQKSGILAEAQRNVSESLKPLARSAAEVEHTHGSEPAKFYSLPSQMYSVPAKFYSEPAKVYSEPAKVYGQPEKFYSEPAKVYGQPAKFYSEPAKVYSQPAKVYGEPAKTYWPRPPQAVSTSSTDSATSISTTTSTTTTPTLTPFVASSSRRPAIVSRIAFGEAQTTQVPTVTGQQSAQTNRQHNHYSHHSYQQQQSLSNANSQARRVLFNLDKLPYDLLNAPEQSPKHLLQPALSRHIPLSSNGGGGFNGGRQRPCLEPPSTSSTSQQHQQHSSLLDQHSNQNAKGLPNRDLVKCVSKYSHSAAAASLANQRPTAYTTERSHIEDLYTPTPEQNYEIEESVSVMTNGRAHGVQGIGVPSTATTARSRIRTGGIGGQHGALYNTNANASADDGEQTSTDENYDEDGTDPSDNDNDNEGDVAGTVSQHSSGNHNNGGGNAEDDSKVAYVVEGRNYRKYRVEEKTDDGFIVGEYGVLDHHDGNLRGVRYTADSTINRSLIQKALLTFLKLK